jgi:hypothetical protein
MGKQFDTKLIDELLKDVKNIEDIVGQSGLLTQLTIAILERALEDKLPSIS